VRNRRDLLKNEHDRWGLQLSFACLTAKLLASIQYASGRSCDQTTRESLSVDFLDPREDAYFVTKFLVALYASLTTLPTLKSKFRPEVTLLYLHKNFTYCSSSPSIFHPSRLITKLANVYECSSTHLLAPLSILPSPLRNALSSPNLPLPEGRAGTAWGPS
jgi:hypothetical protein